MSVPFFNRSILDHWKEADPEGWASIVRDLFELYARLTPAKFAELRAAVAIGDAKATSSAAHSLKASFGNMGAMAASLTCGEIEAAADNARAVEARELMRRLETEQAETEAELARYIAALPPDPEPESMADPPIAVGSAARQTPH